MIDALKNEPESPNGKIVKRPDPEHIEVQKFPPKKKSIDNTSYYVAYAKDLCVAMIEQKALEQYKLEEVMKTAIDAITQARTDLA